MKSTMKTAGPQRYRLQQKSQGFWVDESGPLGQHAMNAAVAVAKMTFTEIRVVDHDTGAPTETKFNV